MPTPTVTRTASMALLADLQGARRAVVSLRGEIGAPEVARLVERALSLAAAGRPCLVLDLRRVTHWDYRHLPSLWRLAQRLRAQGGDLRLAAPSTYVSRILQFAGLLDLLATHEDALQASRSYARLPRRRRA